MRTHVFMYTALVGSLMSGPSLHFRARGPHPRYPPRFDVPDAKVSWDVPWPEYAPVEFVTEKILAASYADPPKPPSGEVLQKRGSHEIQRLRARWRFDAAGRPLNPRGRTGMSNRGTLGKWGANHAGDAVVTRYSPDRPGRPLEFVAIRRQDTGEWAIPGGMMEPAELASKTL